MKSHIRRPLTIFSQLFFSPTTPQANTPQIGILFRAFFIACLLIFFSTLTFAQSLLDPTFDTDGKVTVQYQTLNSKGFDAVLQPDGKIVVAGSANPDSSFPANFQISVMRFNTDGSLDSTFDGDGKEDIGVYRDGFWYLLQSNLGFGAVQFGTTGDKPVVGDYDGDGKSDVAVFRPSNGTWYLLGSTQGFAAQSWGISTDLPVPADYDGDGKTDPAVYRNGVWYLLRSTAGFQASRFGTSADRPIQNAFIP